MASTSSVVAGNANLEAEEDFGDSRGTPRWFLAVMRTAHKLWPEKTAANLAVRTGRSTRSAESWVYYYKAIIARKQPPASACLMDGTSFIQLLQDDEGFKILSAVMASVPVRQQARWWRQHARRAEITELNRAIKQQQQRVAALELDAG